MSILALTSDTLIGTAAAGNIEYNGQFFGTDSNASRAQLQRITSGTAVASTSGTSVEFTNFPAWCKRITVMFSGVSTNSTNLYQVQIGSGSYTISGYTGGYATAGGTAGAMSTGFVIVNNVLAANLHYGAILLTNITGNTWSEFGNIANSAGSNVLTTSAGSIALGGTLDRLRIIASSTGNPADTFDAGSVNIMYEG